MEGRGVRINIESGPLQTISAKCGFNGFLEEDLNVFFFFFYQNEFYLLNRHSNSQSYGKPQVYVC